MAVANNDDEGSLLNLKNVKQVFDVSSKQRRKAAKLEEKWRFLRKFNKAVLNVTLCVLMVVLVSNIMAVSLLASLAIRLAPNDAIPSLYSMLAGLQNRGFAFLNKAGKDFLLFIWGEEILRSSTKKVEQEFTFPTSQR